MTAVVIEQEAEQSGGFISRLFNKIVNTVRAIKSELDEDNRRLDSIENGISNYNNALLFEAAYCQAENTSQEAIELQLQQLLINEGLEGKFSVSQIMENNAGWENYTNELNQRRATFRQEKGLDTQAPEIG